MFEFNVESDVFFFFQAEDGIRDYKVTGVQTCALPITPATQTVTGSVSGTVSGKLFITVLISGPAVTNVSVGVSGSTGAASVFPAKASALGPGTFSSTVTVFACVNDPTCATGQLAGSPKTVNVSYQIASGVQGDAVAPRVGFTNAAGNV